MERFVDTFASHYIRARKAQIPVAGCWQATWDVAGDPNLVIVQHLLLGINAHVNYDLAQAVVEVASHEGGLRRYVLTSTPSTTYWRTRPSR